jgi:hypothetical protein
MFGHDNHDSDNQDSNKVATDSTVSLPAAEPSVGDSSSSYGSGTVPPLSSAPLTPSEPMPSEDHDDTATATPPTVDSPTDPGLLSIKQQALQQLTPLVGHLDQTPEEKFRTTMMMIQGSDNQGLIKDAYESAQQITDEKARAQALLDIVNEINYFTQHGSA